MKDAAAASPHPPRPPHQEKKAEEEGPPSFFADSMLGRLARWMRALGYDVEYERAIEDDELVRRARSEGRVILTRDTLLARRVLARGRCILIEGDRVGEQLRQVAIMHAPPEGLMLTRCLRCNLRLVGVEKLSVAGRVPPYVYSTQERFSVCNGCGRIYWAATHAEGMVKELERLLKGG
jgi:uncharacterized protein with PIN domain